jgi:hypothetical protein
MPLKHATAHGHMLDEVYTPNAKHRPSNISFRCERSAVNMIQEVSSLFRREHWDQERSSRPDPGLRRGYLRFSLPLPLLCIYALRCKIACKASVLSHDLVEFSLSSLSIRGIWHRLTPPHRATLGARDTFECQPPLSSNTKDCTNA